MKKNKKGQVVIFAIVGLLLIITISIILLATQTKKTIPEDIQTTKRMENYLMQCTEQKLNDYIERALLTGGFGAYPSNVIRSEDNIYVLSFSAEGYYYGIYDSKMIKPIIGQELNEIALCLYNLMNIDFEIHGDEITFNNIEYEIEVTQGAIIVNFEYEYKLNNNLHNEITRITKPTNLGYFLDKTNELTNKIMSPRNMDLQFNYLFCETLKEEQGIVPRYATDFLLDMQHETNTNFIFKQEFFIIILERDMEIFPFAIKPEQIGRFC